MRIVTLIAMVALLALVTPSALAKGPESATLRGPGIDRPIDFLGEAHSVDTMAPVDLVGQTGLWTGQLTAAVEVPAEPGPAYTVTWVNSGPPDLPVDLRTIHQYIYLEAPGGPLIHTPKQIGLEGWGDGVTGWFQGSDALTDAVHEVMAWAPASDAGVHPSQTWLALAGAITVTTVFVWRSRWRLRRAGVDQFS